MKNYNFKFAGVALSDLGGVTTERPPREVAQYDFTLLDIPGRSGDEYIDNKKYKNVQMTRKVGFVERSYAHIDDLVEKIINWLAYHQGYQEFEDTDHPGMVTYAVLTNFAEVQTVLRRYHKATLKFSRVPFWYLKSATEAQAVSLTPATPTITLNNPFLIESRPIFTFETVAGAHFSFAFTLVNNGITEQYTYYNVSGSTTMVIDCEEEVLKLISGGSTTYKDLTIPKHFATGSTTFNLTAGKSGLSSISIVPRWRCL